MFGCLPNVFISNKKTKGIRKKNVIKQSRFSLLFSLFKTKTLTIIAKHSKLKENII
jgi:hypothetical protein